MNKISLYASALALALLLAVSAGSWIVIRELQAVSAGLDKVNSKVEAQTLLFHRALGKELLVQLLTDVQGAIKGVEDRLRDESSWPRSPDEVQQLNQRLAEALESLPPWAQEELLQRLLPRRWEINALWTLASPAPKDVDGLSRYLRTVEGQISSKPVGSADVLAKRLATVQQEVEKSLIVAERAAAIEAAGAAVKNREGLETALRLVSNYEDDQAKRLAQELTKVLLAKGIDASIVTLRAEATNQRALKDATLRAYGVSRIQQAVLDLRLQTNSAGLDGEVVKKLDDLERTVATILQEATKNVQAQEAERLMRYQVWALSQIKQVRTYKAILDSETKRIESEVERINPLSAAITKAKKSAAATLRMELLERMAPIDQRLLDEAVSQWFRKVYQKRFDELADEEEQLAVVTGFATTTKKSPE